MNFYNIVGRVTAITTGFLKKLGFKNILNFTIVHNGINIILKDTSIAQIRFLEPGTNCITWSTEDFKGRAIQIEGEDNWQNVYDESKFQEALDRMIDKHDAELGITWVTVDFWLNELCLKQNENE